MPLPDYIANTSETMCDFPDNNFFICLVCNRNYMNYKSHIKTLRHYDNAKKKEEEMNKMEIEQ